VRSEDLLLYLAAAGSKTLSSVKGAVHAH